ncbi:MAG: cob(I)yrinic acid a,c-diamide adenosyltransferase [Bacteroidales bacterium]|nr:cob(I)yrinic acid a,c-diamide adenosyltransferase [Bacteroidales bacterium]MDD3521352.1 cob(I)yrinic acid a,c-diamide adenosyltransferase [Bacteroidales bacterium]MDD4030251.1 cob(I)yrinic acid a,c-diamide adenosyltransferase [Bacteroidales bacterium]MDD4434986.1 cob(I)yrinic acid a,c-diamide adenosyltransferase [Bacteroidales bacterium]MDD5732335.1 cob(I)yrinic acid a,c-diamide adenosyltransferase [Bacteroidales bacterium]
MDKIYTRSGDSGSTSLQDGSRISKAHPRVVAYGKVDELISWLGLIRSHPGFSPDQKFHEINSFLRSIQVDLMHMARRLASNDPSRNLYYDFQTATRALEESIDILQARLPALHSFILPYKPEISSQIHIARTICRETERNMVVLGTDIAGADILTYINRLSDYLFVLARFMTINNKCEEDNFV